MKKCIISFEDRQIIDKLEHLCIECVPVIKSDRVSSPISCHADVLYTKTENNTIFVSECQKGNLQHLDGYKVNWIDNLQPGYKTECLLNFVENSKYIIKNSNTALKFETNKIVINTKQGYTKCSCLCVNDDSFITGDAGLYKTLVSNNLDCLLINDQDIVLNGYDHGFIGGASVKLNENEILFFGDVKNQHEKQKIISFLQKQNVEAHFIENKELTDIGSAFII